MQRIRNQIAVTIALISMPLVASAGAIENPIEAPDLSTLLLRIIEIIILIAIPIVVLAVIYAGFLFVTAGGNEAKITTAKKVILWTLVGALILLGAQAIASAVQGTVDCISTGTC